MTCALDCLRSRFVCLTSNCFQAACVHACSRCSTLSPHTFSPGCNSSKQRTRLLPWCTFPHFLMKRSRAQSMLQAAEMQTAMPPIPTPRGACNAVVSFLLALLCLLIEFQCREFQFREFQFREFISADVPRFYCRHWRSGCA